MYPTAPGTTGAVLRVKDAIARAGQRDGRCPVESHLRIAVLQRRGLDGHTIAVAILTYYL